MTNKMYDRKEFFSAYFSRASEKSTLVDSFKFHFGKPIKDSIRILDLGCHDGTLILRMLDAVKDKLPGSVHLTGVDPSEAALNEFKAKKLMTGVTAEFFNETTEKFLVRGSKKFDWVVASHCLYWSDNLRLVLRQTLDLGDSIVIVMRRPRGIYQIQKYFKRLLGNPNEKFYTSQDVDETLTEMKIKFTREDHRTKIDLPDPTSEEFKWLISFFLQTTDDRLKPHQFQEVTKFMKTLGSPMQHDVSFFWIQK
jgi:hypothetical protein